MTRYYVKRTTQSSQHSPQHTTNFKFPQSQSPSIPKPIPTNRSNPIQSNKTNEKLLNATPCNKYIFPQKQQQTSTHLLSIFNFIYSHSHQPHISSTINPSKLIALISNPSYFFSICHDYKISSSNKMKLRKESRK